MVVVLGGLIAGLVHVLSGPDHLAAVAPYASLERKRAWRVGLRWGLGHTGGVLVVGILALLLRGLLHLEQVSSVSERLVGVMLLVIGLWGLRTARRVQPDVFTSGETPAAGTEKRKHSHAAFGVGILHGLAGSSHLLGILPALALPSTFAAAAYLSLFGAGTVLGMMAFASVLGFAALRLQNAGQRGYLGYKALLYACAVGAIGVGLYWLFNA